MRFLLRCLGYDSFDDFDLLVHVHEVAMEHKASHLRTQVRLSAGHQKVSTDKSSRGIFQTPLLIHVEQGTVYLLVELISESGTVIAAHKLNIVKDILRPSNLNERWFPLVVKNSKVLLKPKVKLTFCISTGSEEEGLFLGKDPHTAYLLKRQLTLAEQAVVDKTDARDPQKDGVQQEIDVLKQACAGPLEMFCHFGSTDKRYAGVLGPPQSRRWVLAFWRDQEEFERKKEATLEIDMLKILGVGADPSRADVFVISYYDENRIHKQATFRIIDRPTKVWVEMIQLCLQTARRWRKEKKSFKIRKRDT